MTIAPPPTLRIGIDCGGTNTDAVILDLSPGASKVVLASTKTPTTPEVTHGIRTATSTVLKNLSSNDKGYIQSINIGTTHFVNALIQRSEDRLERVAVIRLCGPFSRRTPPFAGFPYELKEILQGPHFFAEGGLQIDGSEITKVDEKEIQAICDEIKKAVRF
jgi:N-methylhydantoinase A/oxoprolinase/acetone carboxylase beta subunit